MRKLLKNIFCHHSGKVIWLIIAAGVFMRVEFYLANPVDMDEYFTSYNIVNFKITKVLELSGRGQVYNQAQPLGFLIIENAIAKLFGASTSMLRLFPFVCGLFSLLLFYKVAKLYCEPISVSIALMFFAVSPQLIRYSSIVKCYSCDVLIGLLLLLGIKDLQEKPITPLRIILWGSLGSAAMWISYAAILILSGLGMVLIFAVIKKREGARLKNLSALYFIWAINLIFIYHAQLNSLTGSNASLYYWQDHFLSFKIKSLAVLGADANILWQGFQMVRLVPYEIAILMCCVGCVYMFAKKRGDFFYLMSPILLVVIASGLGKYPFCERLILFLAPILIVFISEGIGYVIKNRIAAFPGIIFFAILIYQTSLEAKSFLLDPSAQFDPIQRYMSDNWRAGDVLYTYYSPNPNSGLRLKAMEKNGVVLFVYAPDICGYFSGEEKYAMLSDRARNNQVWVGFFNVDKNKEKEILAGFDEDAVKVNRIAVDGRVFYLYNRKHPRRAARIPARAVLGSRSYLFFFRITAPNSSDV